MGTRTDRTRRASALAVIAVIGVTAAGVIVAGCGEALGIDDDPPADTDGGDARTDGSAGEDAQADGAPIHQCAAATAVSVPVVADTGPFMSECDGAIGYGVRPFVNLSANDSFLLVRFLLQQETATALRDGRVRGMRLVLSGDPTRGGGSGVDPLAGTLRAHVLRNDWDEGTRDDIYSGADKCRRTSGESAGLAWGAGTNLANGGSTPIAQGLDFLESVGAQAFADNVPSVTIELAAAKVRADWTKTFAPSATDNNLSLYVLASSGRFVTATNGVSTNPDAPRLVVDVCDEVDR